MPSPDATITLQPPPQSAVPGALVRGPPITLSSAGEVEVSTIRTPLLIPATALPVGVTPM